MDLISCWWLLGPPWSPLLLSSPPPPPPICVQLLQSRQRGLLFVPCSVFSDSVQDSLSLCYSFKMVFLFQDSEHAHKYLSSEVIGNRCKADCMTPWQHCMKHHSWPALLPWHFYPEFREVTWARTFHKFLAMLSWVASERDRKPSQGSLGAGCPSQASPPHAHQSLFLASMYIFSRSVLLGLGTPALTAPLTACRWGYLDACVIFLSGAGDWTQGLSHARQARYAELCPEASEQLSCNLLFLPTG
jgi:hypothetical protein